MNDLASQIVSAQWRALLVSLAVLLLGAGLRWVANVIRNIVHSRENRHTNVAEWGEICDLLAALPVSSTDCWEPDQASPVDKSARARHLATLDSLDRATRPQPANLLVALVSLLLSILVWAATAMILIICVVVGVVKLTDSFYSAGIFSIGYGIVTSLALLPLAFLGSDQCSDVFEQRLTLMGRRLTGDDPLYPRVARLREEYGLQGLSDDVAQDAYSARATAPLGVSVWIVKSRLSRARNQARRADRVARTAQSGNSDLNTTVMRWRAMVKLAVSSPLWAIRRWSDTLLTAMETGQARSDHSEQEDTTRNNGNLTPSSAAR
ncbi:hypothetical protein [Gordonia aichiensis]